MAKSSKKKTTKKKTAKKASSARSTKKSTTKKAATKKVVKKAAKKKVAKKKVVKKAAAKKTTKKAVAKKIAKKAVAKKAPAKTAKKTTVRKVKTKKSTARKKAGAVHGMRSAGSIASNGDTVQLPLEELTQAQLKRAKSGLKKADLVFFRNELLERRAEILGDVEGLDAARNSSFGGEVSNMPLHMADVGSENYDREFNLSLLESEKKLLRDIDEALVRIGSGTYGVCHASGNPIERIRLEIKPWAKYCIEIARERERRGLPT